jgi:hypothetical protein
MCTASKAAAGLVHVMAIARLASKWMDQRTAISEDPPPAEAILKQKTRG